MHTTVETAIAVKYSQDLCDRRTRELLAIEREASFIAGRSWLPFTQEHAVRSHYPEPSLVATTCLFAELQRPRGHIDRILSVAIRVRL
jgi:hypothetical protein